MEKLILNGGQVERDFASSYSSSKEGTEFSLSRAYQKPEGRDIYFVFGMMGCINPGL